MAKKVVEHPTSSAVFLMIFSLIIIAILVVVLNSNQKSPNTQESETSPIVLPEDRNKIYPKNSLVAGPIAIKGRALPGEEIDQVRVLNNSDKKIPVALFYRPTAGERVKKPLIFSDNRFTVAANSEKIVDVSLSRDLKGAADIVGNVAVRGEKPLGKTDGVVEIKPLLTILIPVALQLAQSKEPDISIFRTFLAPDRLGIIPVAELENKGGLALDISGQFVLSGNGQRKIMSIDPNQFLPKEKITSISGSQAWNDIAPGQYRLVFELNSGSKTWRASYPVEIEKGGVVGDNKIDPVDLSVAADLSGLSRGIVESRVFLKNQSSSELSLEIKTAIRTEVLISLKEIKKMAKTPEDVLKMVSEKRKQNKTIFSDTSSVGAVAPGLSKEGVVSASGLLFKPNQRYFLNTEIVANNRVIASDSQLIGQSTNQAPKSSQKGGGGVNIYLFIVAYLVLIGAAFIVFLKKKV